MRRKVIKYYHVVIHEDKMDKMVDNDDDFWRGKKMYFFGFVLSEHSIK